MRLALALSLLLTLLASAVFPPLAEAQLDCGVVDAIDYPLPGDRFRIGFGFGAESRRFGGLLHGGEDWWGRNGKTLGEPVYAVARGRVTLSSATVWGPDKGVVIIAHTMPDRSVWYSLYGHLEPLNGYEFPTAGSCVQLGDIVGAIGAGRASPHLHFEIRNFNSDQPGPNYWSIDPKTNGWANPTQFIIDWQTWLRGLDAWRLNLYRGVSAQTPAIMRDDGTILYLDGSVIFAVSPARQYVWYSVTLSAPPVGMVRTAPENFTVALETGQMEDWTDEGVRRLIWQAAGPPSGPPIAFGDRLLVHTPDGGLTAYGPDRAPAWQIAEVDRIVSSAVSGDTLALTDRTGAFWLLDGAGQVIDQAKLNRPGDLAAAPGGGFYVRSSRGLWRVSAGGQWRWLGEAPRANPVRSQLVADPADGFYLWTGWSGRGEVIAYDAEGAVRWRTRVPDELGAVSLTLDGACRLLVGGNTGHLYAFDRRDGEPLANLRLYGDGSPAFVGVASDGLARFLIYDKLVAFDLEAFTGPCN
ncbi:MAG: peptidoglycan DD-metalloendopeptidase family protein [Anaerolineae bacterium]|nr:peptidoglycan DD-metalloendopeptidase family protein [Anaerolineae bacterium]